MIGELKEIITKFLNNQGITSPVINLTHPEDISFGDFTTNVSLAYSKQLKVNPKQLAEKIIEELNKNKIDEIESIKIAGPGFINFKIKDSYFAKEIIESLKKGENIGKLNIDKDKKIMVEYTDPNPFKIFHIGHLVPNAVGESISRIVEFSGANVIRACYQGDVGLHVAKTIWAIMKDGKFQLNVKYLGDMYVVGNNKYDEDEITKKEIVDINKKIFDKSDSEINKIYEDGRRISLEYFDTIYKKLGTKFNNFFFESEVADDGVKIVKEFLAKGVFEESDGAIIFLGEKYGEHTRVFINSQGLPTYEAKELGLTKQKFDKYPDLFESIVVTANEQNAYFKVILATLKEINTEYALKTKHISHGLLRPASGKMSSRKGNIVSADDLIGEFEELVGNKIADREFTAEEKNEIKSQVAIAGLKYTILRQAIGGDIIYDPDKAVSFEGDSGPYLQYSVVRANAIVAKVDNNKEIKSLPDKVDLLEKLLVRFPEIIERSRVEYAPHYIVTYLTQLSSAFNSYYANYKIIDDNDPLSPYRIALTKLFAQVMTNGLWVLGITVPKRM
jgi:arginyl-tRNA synthetase